MTNRKDAENHFDPRPLPFISCLMWDEYVWSQGFSLSDVAPFPSSISLGSGYSDVPAARSSSNLRHRFSGPSAAVAAMPRAIMAMAAPMVVLYAGTGLPFTPVIDTDSAIAFTICADGEAIMFPIW